MSSPSAPSGNLVASACSLPCIARLRKWRLAAAVCQTNGLAVVRRLDPTGAVLRTVLIIAFALGLAVRLWGLARAPLEFHPARQFMGAAIARHYYLAHREDVPEWRRQVAEKNMRSENMLEPHILERSAALGYALLGGERLWLPRGMAVFFWLLGGWFLHQIALRLIAPVGALVAVLFYLFMPFGILASRSFQPDPLMLCLELAGILALLRFAEHERMPRLLLAAVLCAAAVFVKPVCLPVLLGVYGIGSLHRKGLWGTVRSRFTWALAAVLVLPVAFYLWKIVLDTGSSDLGGQAEGSIVPALLLTRLFWRGLLIMLGRVVGFIPLLLALAGLLLTTERAPHRGTLSGLWLGYAVFALTFTYHTHTHDYYHVQLLPIAALSIGALAVMGLGVLAAPPAAWCRRVLAGLVILVGLGIGIGVAMERRDLTAGSTTRRIKALVKAGGAAVGVPQKFMGYLRPDSIGMSAQVAAARAVGKAVDHSMNTILLGEDGGAPLTYIGDFSGIRWPTYGHLRKEALLGRNVATAEERLRDMLSENPQVEYFVVTDFGNLAQQPDLVELLAHYPVVTQGPGHAVHSLRR